jgi:hypothetical protein
MRKGSNIVASLILITVFVVIGTGCKKALDINYNPNLPAAERGTPKLMFPAAVTATTAKVGGDIALLGALWGQDATQAALASQYRTLDAYSVAGSELNSIYTVLFTSGLKNYQAIREKAKASGDWNFYLMATVMKSYTTSMLVDLYDRIPYSEALQGAENLNPKFDDGYLVYKALVADIDTALTKDFSVSTNTPGSLIGTSDLLFQGNLSKWFQFANTLELKMYLRMINSKPQEAQAGVQSLYSRNATFLSSDAGVFGFTDAPGRDNPLYEQNIRQLNTQDNLRASTTLASLLKANNDPRIVYYYGSLNPKALPQGDFTNPDPSYGTAARLVQRPTDPVIFLSAAESYFLQAEARERYFGGAGAKALYDQGVLASFASMGVSSGVAATFIAPGGAYEYPAGGTLAQKIEAIVVQKWISFGYGLEYIEGFFEKNRTGFPKTSPVYSTDPSYLPGQIVISKNSVLSPGQLPKRLPFPNAETSRNSNAPTAEPITKPVWWSL